MFKIYQYKGQALQIWDINDKNTILYEVQSSQDKTFAKKQIGITANTQMEL